jgi:hypothetical protein
MGSPFSAVGALTRGLPAKNAGRFLAEGKGLRSDMPSLAKKALTPGLLKPLAPGNPVLSPSQADRPELGGAGP